MITIKPVTPEEYALTQQVVRTAFAGAPHTDGDEYQLIKRLRAETDYEPTFDVVAKNGATGKIVGHAMLSQITIEDGAAQTVALALAPLAVLPESQHQGVGAALIAYLEAAATQAGYPAISVLGDPAYYGRFGYVPASQYNIVASFDVPDAYYMVKALRQNALRHVQGVVHYQVAFGI